METYCRSLPNPFIIDLLRTIRWLLEFKLPGNVSIGDYYCVNNGNKKTMRLFL